MYVWYSVAALNQQYMKVSAKQLADLVNGTVEGDETVVVSDFAKIEEGKPGYLSFLGNPKYEQFIYTTQSSVVLVDADFQPQHPISATLVRVKSAYSAVAQLLRMVEQSTPKRKGISDLAVVDPLAKVEDDCYIGHYAVVEQNAKIGKGTQIYPQAFIGENVEVGENVIIYPGAVVYHSCVIGNNCIIHSGAIIGADGFGFASEDSGEYKKIPQLGNVILEDEVEIGANTTIDRATMGSTRIGKGVKLDNLVQIAHNVDVGDNTVMAAQCGIAGSTKVGKSCILAGQVGLAGHIIIGDKVQIGAQSGVPNNVEDNQMIFGYPALPVRQALRLNGYHKRLPEIYNTLMELKKEVERLKAQDKA